MGQSAPLPYPGSGSHIWIKLQISSDCDGHIRYADRATITLAERLCRAGHRIDTSGMPEPHHHQRLTAPSAYTETLYGIRQSLADASLPDQGSTDIQASFSKFERTDCQPPRSRQIASSIRKGRSMNPLTHRGT